MKHGSTKKEPEKSWLSKIRQFAWLLPFLYNHFWIAAAFSLIQPFFPKLASSRDLDASEYGFVFSTYKLAMLVGSQGAQKTVSLTSPLAIYLAGQGGYFLFSFVGGCADAIVSVVTFAIITAHFKERSGVVIACMEFVRQAGSMLGAVLGGILIDSWAYPLPHYTFGAILAMSTPVMSMLRRRLDQESDVPKVKSIQEKRNPNYWVLFKTTVFIVDMVSIMMSWMTLGFNDTTLEPSLEKFWLSNTDLGRIFTVQYASCAVGALLSGIFCHYEAEIFGSLSGHVLAALAYIFSLWMVYLSQVFTGLSSAAMFTCSYSHALKVVRFRGFSETIRTKSFVSSSVFTFLVFGGMITPPLAGYLVEILGFRMATMAFCGLLAAWIPVTFAVWVHFTCTTDNV
ncbi:multi-drug resistance efflux pump PmrA homolog isoform X1 [Ixodes scapularis]